MRPAPSPRWNPLLCGWPMWNLERYRLRGVDLVWPVRALGAITRKVHVEKRTGLTTETDNDSSLSGLSLCEAAWQSAALTAPWRDANTARCWWVFGIYSVGLWCPVKAVRFTGLGSGLEPWWSTHSSGFGGGIPSTLTLFCALQQWSTRRAHSPPGLVW